MSVYNYLFLSKEFKVSIAAILVLFACTCKSKNENVQELKKDGDIKLIIPADISHFEITTVAATVRSGELSNLDAAETVKHNRIKFKSPLPGLFEFGNIMKLNPDTIPIEQVSSRLISELPQSLPVKEMAVKEQNPGSFAYFDKLQGLKQSFVTSILQDNAGNIWFGTHGGGLTKYDGKNFTHYQEENGLAGNSVFCMRQASDGALWIGTYGKGISIFDGLQFRNISTRNGLPSDNIYSILEDKNGNIWVGTEGGGLVQFPDSLPGTIVYYNTKNGFFADVITALASDNDGNIWIGSDGKGLCRLNKKGYLEYPLGENFSHITITDMSSDSTGTMWATTYGDGLFCISDNSYLEFTSKNGFPSDVLTSLKPDQNGNFWIGTDGHGVIKMEKPFAGYQELVLLNTEMGLSNDNVYSILQDKDGTLWFGTNRGGVNRFNGTRFTHVQNTIGYPTHHVLGITEDKEKNVWLGTVGNGVLKWISGRDQISGENVENITSEHGLANDKVYCSYSDSKGRVWFGTAAGVTMIEKNRYHNFLPSNGFCGEKVLVCFEDSKSNIWFGLADGGGIAMYDGKNLTCFKDKTRNLNTAVFTIEEDKDGKIWFGTEGNGILIWDGAQLYNFGQKSGFTFNAVFTIFKDADDILWVGTEGNGIFVYNNNRLYSVNESHGLSNNFVFSILEDKNKDMWFGTRFGLNFLDRQKKMSLLKSIVTHEIPTGKEVYFKNYGYEDGFLGIGCNRNSIFQTSDHNIWIGTTDRLTINHLAKQKHTPVSKDNKPVTHITNLELFNEKVYWLDFYKNKTESRKLQNGVIMENVKVSGLSSWYFLPEDLSLKYNNNYLTFYFTSVSLDQPWKVKYRFKMTGLKEDWSAWSHNNAAHYGHLSPGQYTFNVEAMDNNGNVSEPVSFRFTIRNPWWKSWWLQIIYLMALIVFLYLLYINQKNRTIKNERLKSQAKQIEQAKEIEKAYTELKSTQAQLIQSEKMASLGELTAGIAHEIQNPLNFVNNFSEVSNELLNEMTEELERGDIEEAKAISSDIKQNLEKINQHGKRASDIVKSMLQHSRSSTGQKEMTDINALCDEYLRLAYHGLRAKDKTFNAGFDTHFDPELPKISVVQQDIGRVVLNIINNAFYAVNEKFKDLRQKTVSDYQPEVTVRTKNLGDKIEISVSDNGNGIPEHIKEKIFQPFFTTKPTGQGTGLGLSLSYDIVKAHSGEMYVKSEVGKGTEFTIILPL